MSEDLEGRILLTLRRKGMTQRQLAQVIGISDVYLSDIIRGKRTGPKACLLYTSPSPRDVEESRMPSSA